MKRLPMNHARLGILLLSLSALSLPILAEEEDALPQNNVIPAMKKPIGPGELYHLMDRACYHGDDMGVQMLLNAGAEPDGVNDYKDFMRFEPTWHLHQAAFGGHLKIVDMLLKAGAKVDLQCGEGETALFMAVYQNHPKVVERLLAARADSKIKVNGKTVLDLARTQGLDVIVAMLERAAGLVPKDKKAVDDPSYQATIKAVHERLRFLSEEYYNPRRPKSGLPPAQEEERLRLLGQLCSDDPVWALARQIEADLDALLTARPSGPGDPATRDSLRELAAIVGGVVGRATTREQAQQFATDLRQFVVRRDVAGAIAWTNAH